MASGKIHWCELQWSSAHYYSSSLRWYCFSSMDGSCYSWNVISFLLSYSFLSLLICELLGFNSVIPTWNCDCWRWCCVVCLLNWWLLVCVDLASRWVTLLVEFVWPILCGNTFRSWTRNGYDVEVEAIEVNRLWMCIYGIKI